MHIHIANDLQFLTHPAGIICVVLAAITLVAVPKVRGLSLFALFAATVIAGIVGYLQVH